MNWPAATAIRRVGEGLLVVLALVLPFEAPLFRLGPLEITSVEVALYAMLVAWGLATAWKVAATRPPPREAVARLWAQPMTPAAILWCAVLFASAASAPSHRAAAIKFALRSLSGVLAFFAARALSRSPDVRQRVLFALVTGAALSAITAVAESLGLSSPAVWTFFRQSSFDAFGLARASGVFAYPTIGAMYWEAAVPLVLAAPFLAKVPRSDRTAIGRTSVAVLLGALLVGAILASATRSALVGVLVACGAMLALTRRAAPGISHAALGVIGVLVASSATALSLTDTQSLLGQRLRWWHDDDWFRVEFDVGAAPSAVQVGEVFRVPVRLRNKGALTWLQAGAHPTRLAYHWEPGDPSALAEYDGLRTDLPANVPPGGVIDLVGTVRAPRTNGKYRLRWDLVEEFVTWFSDRGNEMPDQPVDVGNVEPRPAVEESGGVEANAAATGAPSSPTIRPAQRDLPPPRPPRRLALWRAAVVLWQERPLLGIGPDNFRRRYEAVLSPAPDGQPYTDTRLHANNLYFETLADLGLAGIVSLAFIAFALFRLLRKHYAAGHLARLACGVSGGIFFVHGVIDYFLEFTPLFGLFWVLLALTATEE